MKKITNEEVKTFFDSTVKSWFMDGENIKIGDNISKIISGDFQTLEVKELFHGDIYKTWKIVITKDDKIYLLKTSKELK
jgi:ABC-type ATPase with predicted acetyltransferase domain